MVTCFAQDLGHLPNLPYFRQRYPQLYVYVICHGDVSLYKRKYAA